MSTFIRWVLCIVYIILKSINDAEYIRKQKSKGVNHLIEWMMVAIVVSLTSPNPDWVYTFLFDVAMLPIVWILTDALVNWGLGENPLLHVGGGWWDQFFKLHFSEKVVPYAIWIMKLLTLILSWYIWSRYLIRN